MFLTEGAFKMQVSGHVRKRESKDNMLRYQIIIELPRDKNTGKRKRIYKTVDGNKKHAEKIMRSMMDELENNTYVKENKNWNKEFFIFLYKWCLSNFYSLSNLFEDSKINSIIDIFDNSNYIETDAYVFTELILKYYREQNDERKLNTYYEKLLKYPQCNS